MAVGLHGWVTAAIVERHWATGGKIGVSSPANATSPEVSNSEPLHEDLGQTNNAADLWTGLQSMQWVPGQSLLWYRIQNTSF